MSLPIENGPAGIWRHSSPAEFDGALFNTCTLRTRSDALWGIPTGCSVERDARPSARDGLDDPDRLLERLVLGRGADLRDRARRGRCDDEPDDRRRRPREGDGALAGMDRARGGRAAVRDRGRARMGPDRGDGGQGRGAARSRIRARGRAQGPPLDPDRPAALPDHLRDRRAGAPVRGAGAEHPGEDPRDERRDRGDRGGHGRRRQRQRDGLVHRAAGDRRGRGGRAGPRAAGGRRPRRCARSRR